MTGDVFEEDPIGIDLADDPGNIGPEVAFVVGTLALSGLAEGLTRVSGEDGIESATEGPCIEGGDVVPDRGWREISGALSGDKDRSGILLPFDEGAGVEAGFGQHEAHIKSAAACAEG